MATTVSPRAATRAHQPGARSSGADSGGGVNSTNNDSVTMRASGYRLFSNSAPPRRVPRRGWQRLDGDQRRNAKKISVGQRARRPSTRRADVARPGTSKARTRRSGISVGNGISKLRSAFGESDTGITTVDADGVTLAAIRGLNELEEQRAENAALKRS